MNYKAIIAALIAAIKTVEALMPQSAGKDKFDAALLIVQELVGPVDALVPQLQALATLLVNGYRMLGLFAKPAVAPVQ